MSYYYVVLTGLTLASLFILTVLTSETGRLSEKTKKRFYLTYGTIALAALAEFFGVLLNGAPAWTKGIHAMVKCLDYCFTPAVGMLIIQAIPHEEKWIRLLKLAILGNTVLQLSSLFTGWTFYVDEANYYHHGPVYNLYLMVYLLVILTVCIQYFLHAKKYERQNKVTLLLIVLLAGLGITVQELSDGNVRMTYLTLMLGTTFLFIRNSEFLQQDNDRRFQQQQRLLETDAQTGLKNRYSYIQELVRVGQGEAPGDCLVFMIDINGLKVANDTMGHAVGEELICGVAQCIRDTFLPYGEVYRMGGDEFAGIIRGEEGLAETLYQQLEERIQAWHGDHIDHASISIGYALAKDYQGYSLERLVNVADRRMYEAKAAYYHKAGIERRG